jgi:hypothetical protein
MFFQYFNPQNNFTLDFAKKKLCELRGKKIKWRQIREVLSKNKIFGALPILYWPINNL